MSSENRDLSSQPTPLMHPANNSHQESTVTSNTGVPHFDPQQPSSSHGAQISAPLMVQPVAGSFHSPQPSPAHGFADGAKTEQERYGAAVPSSSAGPGQFGLRKPPTMLPPGHQWPPQQGPDGIPYPGPNDPSQQQQQQIPPGYGPPPQGMYPQQHPYWQQNRYQIPPPHGYGPPQHMISPLGMPYGVPTNPAYGVPTPGAPPPHPGQMMQQQARPPPVPPGQLPPQEWQKTNGQPPVSMPQQPNFHSSQGYAQPQAHTSLAYQLQPQPPYYQQRKEGTTTPSTQNNQQQPSLPIQSPSTASVPDDSLDDSKSHRSSPSIPQTPGTGQRTPHVQHPGPSSTPSSTSAQHSSSNHPPKLTRQEILEKLVNEPAPIPPEMVPERRKFFDLLLTLNENNPEPLSGPPQVSKSVVDLHRLYIAVRDKGGFETVTKEKAWKNMCSKANATMSESSAAGYQLRRHYQRHLLTLECRETGQNAASLVEFAEKLKKKKKDKDPNAPDKKSAAQQHQQQQQPPNAGPQQPPPGYPMPHQQQQ
uniref:ARID domain-containing protein n=1 Tax=Acrobeloides nanus TaxID=290746 RepID=A0A914EAF1_9BILA